MPEPRLAMAFEPELWKQWEGYRLDDVFPLGRCAGGSGRGAVFETEYQGRAAAIKIIPGTSESTAALLASWEAAAKLSHPNLVRTFAGGETILGETPCAYLVTERADENLEDVLAERPLTHTETRDMLAPVVSALRYLHSNGFVHASVRASNVMAFDDQLKISTDRCVAGGDTTADVHALGALLERALGGDRAGTLPEPFGEIARNCRNPDPAARWDLARIEARLGIGLSGGTNPPASPRSLGKRWWGIAAAAAVILGLVAVWPSRESGTKRDLGKQTNSENVPPPAIASTKAESASANEPKPANASIGSAQLIAKRPEKPDATALDGIKRVMPNIPQAALNTINGRVRINIHVTVDPTGRVSQALLEPPPASKYFTDRVLAAAEAWTFPPGSASKDWVLHFELMRDQTRVSLAGASSR